MKGMKKMKTMKIMKIMVVDSFVLMTLLTIRINTLIFSSTLSSFKTVFYLHPYSLI